MIIYLLERDPYPMMNGKSVNTDLYRIHGMISGNSSEVQLDTNSPRISLPFPSLNPPPPHHDQSTQPQLLFNVQSVSEPNYYSWVG